RIPIAELCPLVATRPSICVPSRPAKVWYTTHQGVPGDALVFCHCREPRGSSGKQLPMNASECFKAGKLREAIDEQTQVVKSDPADQGKRLFLFEVLSFAGAWERARRQIEAVSYSEMELETAVMEYRRL